MIRRKDGTVLAETEIGLDLSEQDLQETDFRGLYIEGGDLSDSDLRGSDFRETHFYGTYCYRANFSECDFSGALLQGVVLDETNLGNANFFNARLIADAMGGCCTLRGADLRSAKLKDSVLTGCKYDAITLFPDGFDPVSLGMVLVD